MEAPDHDVSATVDGKDGLEGFPNTIVPLSAFLDFLSEHNVVKPSIECHDVKVVYKKDEMGNITAKEYTIQPTKSCCLQPLKVPAAFKEDWDNVGSRFCLGQPKNIDWNSGKHNYGYLQLRDRLVYQDTKQFQGIAPAKPGFSLVKPVRVVKGTLRRWA